jgi:cob(I)alamin adenosyltransferase
MKQQQSIYTRTGDKGKTSLIGGLRVEKTNLKIKAYGSLDELSSHIGFLKDLITKESTNNSRLTEEPSYLEKIQHDLYWFSAELAGLNENKVPSISKINSDRIKDLEKHIDLTLQDLPPLKNFIIPGGHLCISQAHIIRTICRKSEIDILALHAQDKIRPELLSYINRLSDWFFALIRKLSDSIGINSNLYTK